MTHTENTSDFFCGRGPEQGVLIALIGADGSGKSTLAEMLAKTIARRRKAQNCYLGLGSADIRDKIADMGAAGKWLASLMVRRADQARDKKQKIPGPMTAIVMYALSRKRLARFKAARRLRDEGYAVITDRYPQMEVPGIYDGPLLSAARAEGFIVSRLAAAERRLYDRMVAARPDLVVKLKIDPETALSRKPDHRRHDIEIKVAVTEKLTFNDAPMVEVDASRPLDAVFAEVKRLVSPAVGIPVENMCPGFVPNLDD
ncbi:MAG: hypothetical protein ACE5EM_06120 [Sphingomonadales bacterium]